MFFFKKREKRPVPVADKTKVVLLNGPRDPAFTPAPPWHTYSLCEWLEGTDGDFSRLALECAMVILDEYPIVINKLWPRFLGETIRNDPDILAYLERTAKYEFGGESCVITLSHGPDRNLVASFDPNDEWYQINFYGYRQLPGTAAVGTQFPYDIDLYFFHLDDCLMITTLDEIDAVADKIRPICEKYGKTLVIREPRSSQANVED